MLKEIIKGKPPVHTRDIRLSTFAHGPDRVIVHGELKDERCIPIVDILGRNKEPGTVHHMSVTLLIAPDPLRIVEAEAEMMTVPMEQCPETLDCIERIKGLEIKPGFSRQIRSLAGGADGCAHLCTLIKTMGTEILHGWMVWKRSQAPDRKTPLQNLKGKSYLVNSCRLWKKGGPKYNEMVEAMEKEADQES
ncbi:MAG: DUF2889 domain-containing protein [Desulfobacterales bacterium]|nr:DUF2889 domain-containing protein [Desulfobacterales bacterium]